MNRMRTAVVVLGGAGALWLGASPGAWAGDGTGGVHLLLNGAFDNRPGELIDIDVQGLRAHGDVTVTSSVFPQPVRLTPYRHDGERGHHARPAVATTVRPGSYPLRVHAGGKVVAEENVEVKAAQRPVFQVASEGEVLRPGERQGISYDDLWPGETGDVFTASSPAFRAPVRLVHDPQSSDWNNPRMFTALVTLPTTVKDGTYKVRLTDAHGRTVDEKPLEVRAAHPGDRDYVGRARGPAFFAPTAHPEAARTSSHRATAGGTVNVLWRDASPDPGEEDRLTATSPAFEQPVPLRRDDSKAGDGDDPRYFGPARLRDDLATGRYPVTVISHHGRVKRTGHLIVAGLERRAEESGFDNTALIAGASAGGLAGVAAVAGVVLVRRRRRTLRDG